MKFFRIILLLVFGALIFSCTRRKKAPTGLAGLLERHFPNRFQILGTRTVDPIGNLSFQVKKSIVAEKTDPLLQVEIKWDKRDPEPKISPGEIDSLFEKAKLNLASARSLFAALKSAGFSKTSVGVRNGFVNILVFEEPLPEARRRFVERMKTVLSGWPDATKYGFGFFFMEPGAFGAEFGDIVPQPFWERPDSWFDQKTILRQQIHEVGENFNVLKIGKKWQFNTKSERLGEWLDRAQPIAEEFAKAHLKKTVAFSAQTEISSLEKKLGAKLRFPFFDPSKTAETPEVLGYVAGNFLLDEGVFENLSIEKD